ncbi:hypothetical protein KFE25_002737 [Diacronema lutheri]|uniref:Uncharacterized protein n=1 Tax=Diacronema lutheri TaxID=2081491 RepID=A0A8J5XU16_DIALT|nr:hypothetical protein KFE25_002737 [Diacronema lutheri]
MVVRQEVPRGVRRSGELLSQRAPVEHDSAHAHEDADLVSKVAPLPHKYNYRTPCFRDLQTQNAYLRGQVAKLSAETRDEASELEYYKGQVHELTVHRAVLHKENERLLAERRAVEEAAARNAASHDRHLELAQSATRLRTQLEDSLALNDSLRDELRAAALARAADGVRAQALERELGTMEAELRAATARGRALRDEAASSAHQLRQAHLLLSKTQDSHSNARSKLDELSAQHESMKATFRAQAALTESLDQQLRRARDDARGNATGHENTAHDLTREREAHVGTRQALAAAQLEVERLQQKLDWMAEKYGEEELGRGSAQIKLRDAHEQIAALQARMSLYSQWVGVGGQDAVKMRQWSKHDARLREHLTHERDQRDKAWFRAEDLRGGARALA